MKKYFPYIAILLPLIVMLGWILSFSFSSLALNGTIVRLKIQGYDPRDLLSGNYLRYQINYDFPNLCEKNIPLQNSKKVVNKCVCLSQAKSDYEISKVTWVGNCDDRPANCSLYLKGYCKNARFITGLDKFYIPETLKINSIPENANVVLKILNGDVQVLDIEVNGTSILKNKSDK